MKGLSCEGLDASNKLPSLVFSSRTQPSQSPRFTHLSLFLWLNMHFYKCHFPDPLSTAFCKTQLRHTSVHTGPSSCQPRVPPRPPPHTHTSPPHASHTEFVHIILQASLFVGRQMRASVCAREYTREHAHSHIHTPCDSRHRVMLTPTQGELHTV